MKKLSDEEISGRYHEFLGLGLLGIVFGILILPYIIVTAPFVLIGWLLSKWLD